MTLMMHDCNATTKSDCLARCIPEFLSFPFLFVASTAGNQPILSPLAPLPPVFSRSPGRIDRYPCTISEASEYERISHSTNERTSEGPLTSDYYYAHPAWFGFWTLGSAGFLPLLSSVLAWILCWLS
jgi:hypothetical protein